MIGGLRRWLAAAAGALMVLAVAAGPVFAADPSPAPSPSATAPAEQGVSPLQQAQRLWGYLSGSNNRLDDLAAQKATQAVDCKVMPAWEVPGDSLPGQIDPGPSTPVDSVYGRYGYAGWSQIVYDPGCFDSAVLGGITKMLPGDLGKAGSYIQSGGATSRAVNTMMNVCLLLVAVLVFFTRTAFGQGPLWVMADAMTTAAASVLGGRVFLVLIGFTFLATGLWFLYKQRLSYERMGTVTGRFAVVFASALLAMSMHASLGPQLDKLYQGSMSWALGVAIGGDTTVPDAGSAVGEVLIGGVIAPGWEMQHLGYNKATLDAYGARLHAARTLTRDEAAQVRTNPSALAGIEGRKEAEFRQVAMEVAASDPVAYARLAQGSDDKILIMWLVIATLLLVFIVAGWCIFAVAVTRLVWRLLLGVWPGAAVFVAYPRLQPVAVWAKDKLAAWTIGSLAATIVFVAYLRVSAAAVLPDARADLFVAFFTLLLLTAAMWWAWRKRGEIAAAIGLDREMEKAGQWARRAEREVQSRSRSGRRRFEKYMEPYRQETQELAAEREQARKEAKAARKAERRSGVQASTEPRITDPEKATGAQAAHAAKSARAAARAAAVNPPFEARLTRPEPGATSRPGLRRFQAVEAEELAVRRAKLVKAGAARAVSTAAVKAVPQARPVVAALTIAKAVK